MKISRSNIVSELYEFSQQGNGVIIGKPGIGKSYSIAELATFLTDLNIPTVILPIDTMLDGSDNSISAQIESEGDWISYLDRIDLKEGQRAVLIFDAFDAARDEELRKQILKQIGKAISRLKKWNILVSVRTYDASKSPQLLKMFSGDYNNYSYRKFEIPELTEQELNSAFDETNGLRAVFEVSDDEFKKVLRIPFFLKLLEIVLHSTDQTQVDTIKLIKSETELLDSYWNVKIANTENSYKKETCLTSIAKELVLNRTLSCLKDKFVEHVETFMELRSDDIISEVGVGEKYVTFSHNILFDYIVGRLVIPAEPEMLVTFINEDKSRAFFLRPSLIFHFTRLWHYHRTIFWSNYEYLDTQTDSTLLLFRRLIPTSVIANEFETISDLDPIIQNEELIQQLLQSIRFLSNRSVGKKDLELLLELSGNFNFKFLWEFAFVLDLLLREENICKTENFMICGTVSRRFLKYILDTQNSASDRNVSLDRLGSTRGVDFVSRTFSSNAQESKTLLKEVLDLMNTPNFEIWYISSLSDDVKFFFDTAPEFAAEVYKKIFSHSELSDQKTYMGTVTMNLTSNRKQDFELCYYRLEELFPNFLTSAPKIAIEVGLELVNEHVKSDQLYDQSSRDGYEINLGGTVSRFVPDFSSMWHDSLTSHRPAQLVIKIIEYFKTLIQSNQSELLESCLNIYISKAVVGFTWKKLIEFGNDNPEILKKHLYNLALNPIILESNETTYEIGITLRKIFPLISVDQRKKLESAILLIFEKADKDEKKYVEHNVNRLLNCIPRDLITNKKAIEIISGSKVVDNEPTFKMSWSSEPYTTDKWLKEQGVDLDNSLNKTLYEGINRLESFNQERTNSKVRKSEYFELLSDASELFNSISRDNEDYDENLKFSALKEISKFFSIITRDPSEVEVEEYDVAKRAILYSLNYMSKYDKDVVDLSPSAYSPTPRIEASTALIGLYLFNKDEDIWSEIERYVKDANPIVRFHILKNLSLIWKEKPNKFWEIELYSLARESNSLTLTALLNNIYRDEIIEDEENVTQALKIASTRITAFGKRDNFIQIYVNILLYFYDNERNSVAKQLLYDGLADSNFAQILVFRIFDFIAPKHIDNDYTQTNTRENLIQLFSDLVNLNLKALISDDPEKFSLENTPERERLVLIDNVIQRIYFSLKINDLVRSGENEQRISDENKKAYYIRLKPILQSIVESSKNIAGGIMIAHTAHYLIQMLNGVIKFHPDEAKSILQMTSEITILAQKTGYSFDPSSIREVVNLTETIFVDHKELLKDEESLNNLVDILNVYVESGWTQALDLLWKLDEVFK